MKLEQLEVELRPRSRWEGVDLGLAMLQRWGGPVLKAWLATAGMLALVSCVAFGARIWIWALLLWWLKPLFERTVVFVLSRAMFGSTPSVADVLRAHREIWGRGLLRTLTLRRLTTTRALLQPVELLEGVTGDVRAQRERTISREGRGVISAVALTGWLFERALEWSFVGLVLFFTPRELLPNLEGWQFGAFPEEGLGWFAYAACAAHFAAYTITSVLHAASGFGLYLRCRTDLEGWDIEVAFRRLGARVRGSRPQVGATASLLFAFVALLAFGAPPAVAQNEAPVVEDSQDADSPTDGAESLEATAPPQNEAEAALERVLARPEFETKSIRRTLDFDLDGPDVGRGISLGFLSVILRTLAWTGAAVLVVLLAYVIYRGIRRFERESVRERKPTTHVFGLDIRLESLPDDVAAEARALWRRGEFKAALGLLYRASIARLVSEHGLALEASDTEHDCLERVRRATIAERAEFFAAVTNAWLMCAYAKQPPTDERVEALCDGWNAHFGARATEAAA